MIPTENSKKKLLWIGPSPFTNKSYSILARRIIPYFEEYSIWYFATDGRDEVPQNIRIEDKDIIICSGSKNQDDIIIHLYDMIKADVVIYCGPANGLSSKVLKEIPVYGWIPVHMEDEPEIYPYLKLMKKVFTYTKYGVDNLRRKRIKNVYYVPCVVDNSNTVLDKLDCRKKLGVPENTTFMVSMVGANTENDSKGFMEAFLAFKQFEEMINKTNTIFYVHTDIEGPINLVSLAKTFGITKLHYPDPIKYRMNYFNSEYMTVVYNATNVLLNTSHWEGFGMPLAEAQRCGTVLCVPNHFPFVSEVLARGYGRLFATESTWLKEFNTFGYKADYRYVARELNQLRNQGKINKEGRLALSENMKQFLPEIVYKEYMKSAIEAKSD